MEEKENIEDTLKDEGKYRSKENEPQLSNPKEFFYRVLECFPFLTKVYVKLTEFTQQYLWNF